MYLVIGDNGFLGSYIIKNIISQTSDNIIATARNISDLESNSRVQWIQIDVTRDEDIERLRHVSFSGPQFKVVYLAAYHHPDLVQKNPRLAWDINIVALARVLNALENIDCLFYASTDSVYGESHDGYHFKETDELNPENIYGIQKKTAEAIITGFGYNIVRFPFLIGKSILLHKKHFFDMILETLSRGEQIKMFSDSYRSALDFNAAAKLLVALIEEVRSYTPLIINIAGDEDLSKYDIGVKIARKYGYKENLIVPISIKEEDSNIFEAPRAVSTLMDNTVLKKVLNIKNIGIDL